MFAKVQYSTLSLASLVHVSTSFQVLKHRVEWVSEVVCGFKSKLEVWIYNRVFVRCVVLCGKETPCDWQTPSLRGPNKHKQKPRKQRSVQNRKGTERFCAVYFKDRERRKNLKWPVRDSFQVHLALAKESQSRPSCICKVSNRLPPEYKSRAKLATPVFLVCPTSMHTFVAMQLNAFSLHHTFTRHVEKAYIWNHHRMPRQVLCNQTNGTSVCSLRNSIRMMYILCNTMFDN
jgi:hypothetical protein